MKGENLSKEEIEELEEMARLGKDAFRGDLTKIEQTLASRREKAMRTAPNDLPAARSMPWRLILLLAVIAAAMAAFFLLRPKEKVEPAVKYFMTYYEPPPFVLSEEERGIAEETTELSAVRDAYKSGDYAAVLIQTKEMENPGSDFYRAVALLELDRVTEALSLLEQQPNDDLQDMRSWYLALGYLKSNDLESATSVLQEITMSGDHYKHKLAAELLQKMSPEVK